MMFDESTGLEQVGKLGVAVEQYHGEGGLGWKYSEVLTWRRCVSLELRYGIWGCLAARAAKTSPRLERDLLMLQASF